MLRALVRVDQQLARGDLLLQKRQHGGLALAYGDRRGDSIFKQIAQLASGGGRGDGTLHPSAHFHHRPRRRWRRWWVSQDHFRPSVHGGGSFGLLLRNLPLVNDRSLSAVLRQFPNPPLNGARLRQPAGYRKRPPTEPRE